MKIICLLLPAAFLMLFSSSCAMFKKTEEVKLREFSKIDEDIARINATMFAESFIKSLKEDDFTHWQKHIPKRSAHRINEQNFKAMRREMIDTFGTFVSGDYLGKVTNGNLRTYLWKLTFIRDDKGKKSVHEVIYLVRVFCEDGKTPAISRFGVRII